MGVSRWRFMALLHVLCSLLIPASAVHVIQGTSGGVNKETGERPVRRSLTEFEFSGPAFDLYILALEQFQKEDHSELTSGFQVSAIHGYPFTSWDGVEGPGYGGYCSHESTLFPLWHRPYLALYENLIWEKAQKIAATYPENRKKGYVDAAKTLRIPYWDWASNAELPKSVVTREINVNTPTGTKTIRNPLYSYTFNPTVAGGFPQDDFTRIATTLRSPDENWQSQNEESQRTLRANAAYLQINTYQLLSNEDNYTIFSTAALEDRGSNYNNIEILHGLIHVSIGGDNGHMTYTPWSSYDPSFWLHHANVDRIVALWQALHPDSYVESLPNRGGNYMTTQGTIENVNTPLWPFHSSDKDFYTAASSRSTRPFGYTYPEIVDWGVSKEQLQRNVRQKVNALYNKPQGPVQRKSRHGHSSHGLFNRAEKKPSLKYDTPPKLEKFDLKNFFDQLKDTVSIVDDLVELGINNLKKHWVVNVKVDRNIRQKPFRIFFFMGDPPSDCKRWPHARNLIGTFATFSSSMYSTRTSKSKSYVYGQIPLSYHFANILSANLIPDIGELNVLPMLQQNLEWRVQELGGDVVDAGELIGTSDTGYGLEITLAERDVEPLADDDTVRDKFPTVGDWKVFGDITKGAKNIKSP
ncbi:hypothetical protein AJ80_04558 [Polytolypa hystricis UAMH7299]|uniref:tyrosinase n=1 Tax=Polytolypa hystricis (strain UAMH7299) TaxID=1447883 RepID=A0A2B7YAT8_POLH7|nr:hypothetical protein AJ80_04558 [Polytolypa hystricis UAMH7299]